MGDMVNLSARLMASAGDNEVYVDQVTYNASCKNLDFEVNCHLYTCARFLISKL